MNRDCDICGGRGTVTLAVMRPIQFGQPTTTEILSARRDYPCPECGGVVSEERVSAEISMPAYAAGELEPGANHPAIRHALVNLAEEMIRRGLIAVTWGPKDRFNNRRPVIVSVGVIAPKKVATLEERVDSRSKFILHEMASAAVAEINNWGSASRYVSHDISRDSARYCVEQAFSTVMKRLEKKHGHQQDVGAA